MDITFGSWLCGITVYLCLDTLRQNGTSSDKIDGKKLKSLNLSAFEFEIVSLPLKERLSFVLHDLEKYTDDETSELLMMKSKEMNDYLQHAYTLLKTANNSLSQVTPLQERINSLPNQIIPGNEIWKKISSEIQKEKANTTIHENDDDANLEDGTKKDKQERERKFNIFGWKKK